MGVVGLLAPDEAPLLALVSLFAPVITCGNTVVAHASEAQPLPAVVLGEMLATSDLPGGVVNLLTGFRKELVPTFATHAHLRAVGGVASAADRKTIETGAADSVKRVRLLPAEAPVDWFEHVQQGLYAIRDFVEFKTTWHPVGA
jgi:aldehyde dehydrogenase (NAD+)